MDSSFFASAVPANKVRIEVITNGRRHQDVYCDCSDLHDHLLRYEACIGQDPDRMALLRSTVEGSKIVLAAIQRHADEGDDYEVAMGIMWGLAHGPQSPGWAALDALGGRIVRAESVPGRGWVLAVADPAGE